MSIDHSFPSFAIRKGKDAKVENVFRSLKRELEHIPYVSSGEATAMARLIFHSLKGWDATAIFSHYDDPLSPFILGRIDDILKRAAANEPIQYILGRGRFYGMDLEVNQFTLIPRPETEELVDIIIKREGKTPDLRVLDIGTGSGAIALALARNLMFPSITAIDVSPEAIATAERNAERLHAKIDFRQADVFYFSPQKNSFDIIVSNPPYITDSEKSSMEPNVLDYEPHYALFVSDSDPIVFYRRIADMGRYALSPGGRVYFEINPRFALNLETLLRELKYSDIDIHPDICGRSRFISARSTLL